MSQKAEQKGSTILRTTYDGYTRRAPMCSGFLGALCLAIVTFVLAAGTAEAFYAVTSVNAARGLVTARLASTGQTFQFSCPNAVISKLRIGLPVLVDPSSQAVSVGIFAKACKLVGQFPGQGQQGGAGPTIQDCQRCWQECNLEVLGKQGDPDAMKKFDECIKKCDAKGC